jgi:superfamily II DNA or RNA helicase
MYGFIYIRQHPSYSYDKRICCKLGKAINYVDRDSTYATGEIVRGVFTNIYEVPIDKMDIIEKLAHVTFKEYNVRFDGGQEFYTINIVDILDSFFDKMNHILKIKIRKLDQKEINDMLRTKRKKIIKDENEDEIEYLYELYKNYSSSLIVPRKDQEEIINKSLEYYKDPINTKGILVIPCGVGKTMISLWLSLRLNIDLKSIIIGVPNRLLLKQWEKVVKLLCPDFKCFLVDGNVDKDYIRSNLGKKCIVITTYASSFKFLSIKDFTFDVKILDEVHHLTSKKNEEQRKTFIKILDIKSTKQISLTATLKILDYNEYDEEYVSNNNVEYFGEIIDKKSLLWAINEKIVCDYVIQTIITKEENFTENFEYLSIEDDIDKRLFLSAFVALKSIKEGCSHHLLIYNNNKENSLKIISFINIVKDLLNIDLFFSSYHSDIKSEEQKRILKDFENSKYGVISCVYCLGEGWDFPILDGVVFAENMTSNIRIVQSALRASRKNKLEPEKVTKIILPVLYIDDFLKDENNEDLKKVKEVIYQMSMEDETIVEKIKVFKVIDRKDEKDEKDEKDKYEFGQYDEVMTKGLRLKTTSRIQLDLTYQKTKKIIKPYYLNSKEEYYNLCKKDTRLPEDPEETFGKTFLGWFDYLGINNEYYELKEFSEKINKYIKENNIYDIKDLEIICKLDNNYPPFELWSEYYKVNSISELINLVPRKRYKK